jgi:hypothetical protein
LYNVYYLDLAELLLSALDHGWQEESFRWRAQLEKLEVSEILKTKYQKISVEL